MTFSLRFFFLLSIAALAIACEERTPIPRPRAYPRVIYPQKVYQLFDKNYCAFTFEYPKYAEVQQDTGQNGLKPENSCWFDLFYPGFDCRVYCTYSQIGNGKTFDKLKSDAFELVDWHNKKANYIEEEPINRGSDLQGMVFSIDGPAATPFQFFITDTKKHFFRASLYFKTKIRPDSLAPVYDFVKKDMRKMIETFKWN
jgi:gliding motility-associated lipoprotein GldD